MKAANTRRKTLAAMMAAERLFMRTIEKFSD